MAYTSQIDAEEMAIRLDVLYTTYATSSRKQTVNIIKFTQFEEGNLLSGKHNLLAETPDNTEIGNKYDED